MSVPRRRLRAHVRQVPGAVDAEALFAAAYRDSRHAFWLDSARVAEGLSRFSFLGDASGPLAEVLTHHLDDAPPAPGFLELLGERLGQLEIDAPELPFDFVGGYVGYFGYELKAECGSANAHAASTPDAVWIFADRFVSIDHEQEITYLVALGDSGGDAAAAAWLDTMADVVAGVRPLAPPARATSISVEGYLTSDRDEYIAKVDAGMEHLRAGDSYEICLTDEARVPATGDPWSVYRRLRRLNPAPYATYLRCGEVTIACASPERFLRVDGSRVVETKPIKGTAARGDTPAQDAAIARELATDEKMRAENLMIVDLMRNDLGRVCELGSITVPHLFAVESYETVHQLVSTIRGRLRPDAGVLDCVRACFPGGSMTGAPKLRTMEIIESLEGRARGVYSGSIGYLSANGTADLNIVIRTLVHFEGSGEWTIGAGGAIVLDSDPSAEYAEMLLKANASARALELWEASSELPT